MNKSNRLELRVDPTLKQWLRDAATRHQTSMSVLVERGILLVKNELKGKEESHG